MNKKHSLHCKNNFSSVPIKSVPLKRVTKINRPWLVLGYCLLQIFAPQSLADTLTAHEYKHAKPYNSPSSNANNFYGGFGVSDHSSTIGEFEGEAKGFSVFVGYLLPVQPLDYAKFSIEAGYLSTENFNWESQGRRSSADSFLTSGLVEVNIIDRWQLVGRVGYDFGDDVGNFFGAGIGYLFRNGLGIRAEYREQDKIDTVQLNFTMRIRDLLF